MFRCPEIMKDIRMQRPRSCIFAVSYCLFLASVLLEKNNCLQTGSLEGQHFNKTGKLISLSEQQLVDCSTENHGCNGGWKYKAFDYIKSTGGIESEDQYPYQAEEQICKFNEALVVANVNGYVVIPSGSETTLEKAVASAGPVSISIDASRTAFRFYKQGIYDDPTCSSTVLNHAVLAVGYGNSPSDYWLVKNSWGTSWGEGGYIKMSRNKGNQCGVATNALYPVV